MRYPSPSRRVDGSLERKVERAASDTVSIRLPGITARQTVATVATHSWSTSYATGGESVSLSGLVPSRQAIVPVPANGYTFTYDTGSNKLKAFTTAGTEVVATTNLQTAVGTTTILVLGTPDAVTDLWTPPGGAVLVGAKVRFTQSVTRDGTNYWSIHLAIRADGETFGRKIGRRLETNVRGITSGVENELLAYPESEVVASGSSVVLSATAATGATACLGDAVVTLVFQRKVT